MRTLESDNWKLLAVVREMAGYKEALSPLFNSLLEQQQSPAFSAFFVVGMKTTSDADGNAASALFGDEWQERKRVRFQRSASKYPMRKDGKH